MNTLLHMCCAPCTLPCLESLRAEGIFVTGFWNNPNIHPLTEYNNRKTALSEFAASEDLPVLWQGEYGLRPFLTMLNGEFEKRCALCYTARLSAAAERAALEGFESFSTTLLISPYQNHELLISLGEEAGEKFGVAFLYRDFRPLFRQGQAKSKELGLYRQKYCGCIFSEEERYTPKEKKQ